MMGKLIKYEFKTTWKFMCIMFFCACVITAGIFAAVELNDGIVVPLTDDFGNVLGYVSETWMYGIMGFAFLLMAAIVLIICFGVVRFKKALVADEGYLVNTLPVGKGSIIMSKAITFFVYAIPLVGLTFISFFVLFFDGMESFFSNGMFEEIAIDFKNFNLDDLEVANLLLSLVRSITGGFSMLFQLYAAMAIGFSFNRHKKLWSLVAFFAIVFGIEFIAEVFTPIRNRIYNSVPMQYEGIVGLIIEIAVAVIFFFVTYYFMKKRPCVE